MRLTTRFELAGKTKQELQSMLRQAFNEAVKSGPHTRERQNALASIENIQRALASRTP